VGKPRQPASIKRRLQQPSERRINPPIPHAGSTVNRHPNGPQHKQQISGPPPKFACNGGKTLTEIK
jgi:hypothetical protein